MRGRPSLEKRRKELARADRKRDKAERRAGKRGGEQRTVEKTEDGEEVDPDIAGIVPGPQPIAEEAEEGDG
jgi:hypothetical protein